MCPFPMTALWVKTVEEIKKKKKKWLHWEAKVNTEVQLGMHG